MNPLDKSLTTQELSELTGHPVEVLRELLCDPNDTEDFSREHLISLCERAIVQQGKWGNRDSAEAHSNIGQCWAYLKAGCDFAIRKEPETTSDRCITDENFIWLNVFVHGFGWFEQENPTDHHRRRFLFYVPTEKRLRERTGGGDWY